MIDIDKFEQLANEIITKSKKNEMEQWLKNYRTDKVSFVNFKAIEGKFEMDFAKLDFNVNESKSLSNIYSLAV